MLPATIARRMRRVLTGFFAADVGHAHQAAGASADEEVGAAGQGVFILSARP
jgi:hypothetical protein